MIQKMLTEEKRIFAFFGEAGSGKTEIALNWAVQLTALTDKKVIFLDLDQVKFIYRAQDFECYLNEKGIEIRSSPANLDSPVVAQGASGALMEEDAICVLDIGGGSAGATVAGQFSQILNREDSKTFYVLNPFRPFLSSTERVRASIEKLLRSSGVTDMSVIANPCLGDHTSVDDVEIGYKKCAKMIKETGYEIELLTVRSGLEEKIHISGTHDVLPLQLYVRYK